MAELGEVPEHAEAEIRTAEELATVLARLLTPGLLTSEDPADTAALARLRTRLDTRLVGSVPGVLATLGRDDLTAETFDEVAERIEHAVAADESLATDLAAMVDEAARPGRPGWAIVNDTAATAMREHGRFTAALAAYDDALRELPDDHRALFFSAVVLRQLGRRSEALARLRRLSGSVGEDPADQILLGTEFFELDERDRALESAAAAERLAEHVPLSLDAAVDLATLWLALDNMSGALAAVEPHLGREGEPTGADIRVADIAALTLLVHRQEPARTEEVVRRLEGRGVALTEHPTLRLWLGLALLQLHRPAEARPLLDADLAGRVPESLRGLALLGRGTALLETGDVAAEAILGEAAVLLDGDRRAEAELMRTIGLFSAERRDDARAAIERAGQSTSSSTAPVLLGRIALWQALVWSDDATKRAEGLRIADELLPPDWPERNALELAQAQLLARSDPDRSIELLDAIRGLSPALQPTVLRTRALAQAAQGRPGDAAQTLQPLLAAPGTAPDATQVADHLARATLLLQTADSGDAETALDELDRIADTTFVDTRVATRYSELLFESGSRVDRDEKLSAALTRLAKANPPIAAFADYLRAAVMIEHGDHLTAVGVLRPLADPTGADEPLTWLVAAQARQLDGRDDVLAALQRAIQLEPSLDTHPIVRATRILEAAGAGDVESVDAECAAEMAPEDRVVCRLARAMALRRAKRITEAIDELSSLISETENATALRIRTARAQAMSDHAVLLLGRDDLVRAADVLDEAEKIAAELGDGNIALIQISAAKAVLHMKRGEYAEADRALARVPPEGLPVGLAFAFDFLRGKNCQLAGPEEAENALRWLGSAASRRPGDVDTLSALGSVQLDLEDPAAALPWLAKALALTSDTTDRMHMLRESAAAHRMLGHLEAALQTAREALALDPGEPRNWLSLGAAQLELGRHDAATGAFRRGWRIHQPQPDDAVATQLALGLTAALIDGDHAAEALRVLDSPRARRLARQESQIELNRAVALLRLNRRDEAVAALRRSGRKGPADKLASADAEQKSWLGFWFGGAASWPRRMLGVVLIVLAGATLVPVVVDAGRVGWLPWLATDNTRLLAPFVLVIVLFLLPVLTRIKVGDVELEQPAAATPGDVELQAANWDAIERKITSLASAPSAAVPLAPATPPGPAPDPPTLAQ
jgi:tetratricopeptide (TPR) repeat protein